MDNGIIADDALIDAAFAAQLDVLRGGISGATTYRVRGLAEACVLKVVDAGSAEQILARGTREIRFYADLAAGLPVRTPRVLASRIERSGACALLLAAYASLPPSAQLGAGDFAAIATELARLHAAYWNRTQLLADRTWLRPAVPAHLNAAAQHARETWRALARLPRFRALLTAATLHRIDAALEHVRATPEYGPDTAMTLCHGDCHVDNLLRAADGQLVWGDWQEVGSAMAQAIWRS